MADSSPQVAPTAHGSLGNMRGFQHSASNQHEKKTIAILGIGSVCSSLESMRRKEPGLITLHSIADEFSRASEGQIVRFPPKFPKKSKQRVRSGQRAHLVFSGRHGVTVIPCQRANCSQRRGAGYF